jgi:protease I
VPAIDQARILILATDRFEESELFGPKDILEGKGARVTLASLSRTPIQATVYDDPGRTIRPDVTVDEVQVADYDALILPGGLGNPDRLRTEARVIEIIRAFAASGKPVAAICHGPWLLIEAGLVRGRKATGYRSILTDLRNAGAEVVDAAAVTDGNIVTSRRPADVPDFVEAVIALVEGPPALK